jgi:tRNA A-37 threonylcarbamoyl transferase component Bud32
LDGRLVLPANTIVDGDYRIMRVVGAGGFGITYEAEDINLGTMVAIKEYYPLDFGDRDANMSVRPKSERHKPTFEKGLANFLQEARTLARFEHPSIVRVTRVLEANSTAYMVMRFEFGLSFEAWLKSLKRPPTQEELDFVTAPLLDALQTMHAANFLHRDIAPDNIVIRADGTPVLLDFGAARRAVAELSRSLTGIVKAGYSPHEQYSSDGRLQGPWTDIYALGGTLYRAVTGKAPEEATLRFDDDRMAFAVQAAKGAYRRGFLEAIDACLKVRHAERPRSVAELRPMLLAPQSLSRETERLAETRKVPRARSGMTSGGRVARRWPAVAVLAAVLVGAYGAYEYGRWSAAEGYRPGGGVVALPTADAEVRRKDAADALEAERRRREAEADEALRKREAEAEEKRRLAALEDERRRQDAAAEEKRKEESRIAALQETRRAEEKRKEEERLRRVALPDDAARAEFMRRVQAVLRKGRCYDGAANDRSNDLQEALDRFIAAAGKQGQAKPDRIELAKATVGDFEAWLATAEAGKGTVCALKPPPPEKQQKAQLPKEAEASARPSARPSGGDRPGHGGNCQSWMFYNSSCTDSAGRHCIQTPGGRKCQ